MQKQKDVTHKPNTHTQKEANAIAIRDECAAQVECQLA
jgi:hypothetical protein